MDAPRATTETARSLINAELAAIALANEEVRAAELQKIWLQERLNKAKSEVLIYREAVKNDEAAVKAQQDNVKTKEAYVKSLKQMNKPLREKASAMEKQLDEELKRSTDLDAELEKHKKRVDAMFRHTKKLEEKVKRPYDIPNLEKRVAELQEECKSKEAAECAIDEELQKARSKKQRAAQDELNAFIIRLAKLKVEGATKEKQVQELQDEIQQLESTKAALPQGKLHTQARDKTSEKTRTLQLYPVVKTPQNKSCSVSLDGSTSFHFETHAIPSTKNQSILTEAPARLEKGPPLRSAAPSMSPQLMPPPSSAVVRSRPASGGPKLDSLTFLSELQLLLESAPAPKPPAQRRPVPPTSADFSTFAPPCKQPRIDDGSASSSTPALKPPRQHPHISPSERTSPSLAARATPVPAGAQHEISSAPAQATPSQPAAANTALPFGKQASPGTLREKHPIPTPPTDRRAPAPNDQKLPGHGRQQDEQALHGTRVSQPPARQHLLEQLSTARPSSTAQRQALLQSFAMSSSQWSRESVEERDCYAAQPEHPPDDQRVVEKMPLPSPSNMAPREPAKSTTMPAKWIAALQEQQSHHTAHFAKPASFQQERLGLPGPAQTTQRQAPPHPSTALFEASRGHQERQGGCAAELAQPPKQGHMLEQTPTVGASHVGQKQVARSPVASAEWNSLDTQSPEQGEMPKPVDSQSPKESPPQSEFSFGAAAPSPGASVEDGGFTLFGEDDDSGEGGFLSMAGAADSAPRFTF
ncbi:uncharacterized protein LOC142560155 [Dermacentor variabilis]|uniref:uncharacterized protein LOC142560155 n=1 Tax=Dermacentor variabilis TaxID=34621 RepID=UPI003F5B6D49